MKNAHVGSVSEAFKIPVREDTESFIPGELRLLFPIDVFHIFMYTEVSRYVFSTNLLLSESIATKRLYGVIVTFHFMSSRVPGDYTHV